MNSHRLKYIQSYRDRLGVQRNYFRRPGFPAVALKGKPGTAEFIASYAAAFNGGAVTPTPSLDLNAGTIAALVARFYRSNEYKILKEKTQANYRAILEWLRNNYGPNPVKTLHREHIKMMVERRPKSPTDAKAFLGKVSILLDYAIELGWREDNPTKLIKRPRIKTDGHIAWSDADIAAFERKWPVGTRARLALALLLYTGQRRSDVARMGWGNIHGGTSIEVVQTKTNMRLLIPLHPALLEMIETLPRDHATFIVAENGKPLHGTTFTAWFGECAKAAGLKDRSPHGLRKAAGRRLAEAGCTAHQIMSILGHKTLGEAERYTRSVSQEHMARGAIAAIS